MEEIASGFFDWLWSFIERFFDWLVHLVPSWMGDGFATISSAFGPVGQYFAYLAALDQVPVIIIGAYCVRFLVRRLPFLG